MSTESDTSYADRYRGIDFRKKPDLYRVGRGEQGVLIAEPYKSELLPHWRFKTPQIAAQSAQTLYNFFISYGKKRDFVGMDMARKFLQMGWTRSRRYANHPSGTKYDRDGHEIPQAASALSSEKAESARIFFSFYKKAVNNSLYKFLKKQHQTRVEPHRDNPH